MSLLEGILTEVISQTFMSQVGKWQVKKGLPHQAMIMSFSIPCKEGEEGYRHKDLVIYGPMNYVQVWTRESWDVIPEADMDYNEDGDGAPKKGKKYTKGTSEWKLIGDHDSCWRDSINSFLKSKDHNLICFSGRSDFYASVDVKSLNLPEKTR